MIRLNLKSINDIGFIAEEICKSLKLRNLKERINCVAMYGEMGSGKTTLIKAICQKLGVMDVISSPTFSLVNEYVMANGNKIFHFDFYRCNNISEAFDLGYEEYFYSGELCFIEWPEKIESLLPSIHTRINILIVNHHQRTVEIIN